MHVRGPSNVEKAAKMVPTLLCYFAVITEQNEMLGVVGSSLTGLKLWATTPNNTQQHATACTNKCNMWISNNVESC